MVMEFSNMEPLSIAEVLRLHEQSRAQRPSGAQDSGLRRLKSEHLKSRGDEAFKAGRFREACERYAEAIELCPDKGSLPALHSNRSLALGKAGRWGEALAEAEAAAAAVPAWHKAQWRRASALLALKRVPEAVLALREAWCLASSSSSGEADGGAAAAAADATECSTRLWAAVQKLTREELARGLLAVLAQMQAAGALAAPEEEEASEQEQVEALFTQIKLEHKNKRRPGPYYRRYLRWLQEGVQPGEAYAERSAVHAWAKCYLQARADASEALAALAAAQRQQQRQRAAADGPQAGGGGGGAPQQAAAADSQLQKQQQSAAGGGGAAPLTPHRALMALAYERLGVACLAEKGHADRDCRAAAKAFLRAVELGENVQEYLQEASEELSLEEMNEVEREVYNEGPLDGAGAGWRGTSLAAGQRLFRVLLCLAFPTARAGDCSSHARELLRASLAAAAGVEGGDVMIERVMAPIAARPALRVVVSVKVGSDLLKASRLAKAVGGSGDGCGGGGGEQQQQQQHADQQPQGPDTPPAEPRQQQQDAQMQDAESSLNSQQQAKQRQQELLSVLGGEALVARLGQPDASACIAEIEDVTPACAASEAERAEQEAINKGEVEVPAHKDRRLAVPARPKMELELPYKLYKLVRADGKPAERVDKHPFCMSRVYYDQQEKPEEVWTEIADGSCRWRQSGGEVKVLALRVPADLPPKQLAVDIQPYSLKVFNRSTGDVYLEGTLERGVVPEDCFWTHCGGEGEDGCAISLRKMNLEVLQKHWLHSEMWWPKLFTAHGAIAWDDYEKDYSDLPSEVLERHRLTEAIQEDSKRLENRERTHREQLQERDDARKRVRQERLYELRTGTRKSWVSMHRELPPGPSRV
ncbi:Tetratricopeptide repeat 28 [Micractinium conductrix]|uniref:Tetratricopeptide repeat 28 n=1 Tax=Micractinium conductrix TaxID=554055 RepID=A0A2P6UZG4_9CHLO|nr:Tetratricopeptide repeat 28 [Micractinium conductrix]|eukprot:PSC67238.1 Tetratricopeptide repeat 28 [Micractinium conductrix]